MIFRHLLNMRSHPTWVRGLKHWLHNEVFYAIGRTLRGCVDWNVQDQGRRRNPLVAPYVGAWIETSCSSKCAGYIQVAPYVGAWIETAFAVVSLFGYRSRTLRGCVDWNISGWSQTYFTTVAPYVGAWIETRRRGRTFAKGRVAPYVGAWIETSISCQPFAFSSSHPTWVRGLKLHKSCAATGATGSHPTWVRGLKLLILARDVCPLCVAPYVGAWIETLWWPCRRKTQQVAPYVGAWIET